jgi:hypothetical protein
VLGGFFELELPAGGTAYHRGAPALCSGRACLRAVLEIMAPRRAWVPFFICDSALAPFDLLGVPYEFYSLTPDLEPLLTESPGPDECLLYVNYFGLKTASAARLPGDHRAHVVIDDTQAFFERGYARAVSFNSARKFFGVPDGGFTYGCPSLETRMFPPLDDVRYDHLISRLAGRQELAYRQYLEHEQHISIEMRGPSTLTAQLLDRIDYDRVRAVRRQNFDVVHARLGTLNQLQMPLDRAADAVPFCYPFLPEPPLPHEALWQRQIFAPKLWPDVVRRGRTGFSLERTLAERLVPLPIDQRYGARDMQRMCDDVIEALH